MVQCDGCLFWGLGCRAGLVAGLRVGQAYGVFHRPGVGSLVPVPRSLSTQPPFATQALTRQCEYHLIARFSSYVFDLLCSMSTEYNSASDKRFVIDACSTIYVYRYGGKYLLRRIPSASYGSLNSCIITNKEGHMNKWKTTDTFSPQ